MSMRQSIPETMQEPTDEQARHHIDDLNDRAWEIHQRDTAGAIDLAESARALSTAEGTYPRGLGWSLLTLGACCMVRGEHATAREHLNESL